MAKRGIASVPTLVTYRIIQRKSGGYFGSTSRRFELNEDTIVAMAKKLRQAKVKMGIGLDLIIDSSDYMPGAYIDELESFTQIGFSKVEALVAATERAPRSYAWATGSARSRSASWPTSSWWTAIPTKISARCGRCAPRSSTGGWSCKRAASISRPHVEVPLPARK